MSLQFSIANVSSEFIMDLAKLVSSSPYPLSKEDIERSFKKSRVYITNGLSQCLQLGLIVIENSLYASSEKYRDLIKRSQRSQLSVAFRDALQKYPPFLLYADFISKGYPPNESATMTLGILKIQSPEKVVEKCLRLWGQYAKLIVRDSQGNLTIPEAEKGLTSEYVQNLLKALQAELQASIFLVETMSQQAYAYLSEKGIGVVDLADALINYEKSPKASANRACQTFEHILFKLGEDTGVDVAKCGGVIELADALKGQNIILRNQWHLCHGIGALRNMAHHDPDKETGKPWTFTPQGAIISALIVPTMIRSIFLHWKELKQEF